MNEDTFRVRVAKIFASLAPTSTSNSAWSLSDDVVEHRKWRREEDTSARDGTACSSSLDEILSKNRWRNFRLDADDGERVRDEWEIISSIGLDSTLDNEEEEDEFDKVAVGRENAGERLYMNDVNDRGPYFNLHNVVPNMVNSTTKDTGADHHAARIRLREYKIEAKSEAFSFPYTDCDTEVTNSHAVVSQESGRPKSIVKRKDNNAALSPQKCVRFDPWCKIHGNTASDRSQFSMFNTSSMDATDSHDVSHQFQNASGVPDYVVNPSQCTHYTFGSSVDNNQESSIMACDDVLSWVKDSNARELEPVVEGSSCDLPKSITYIPRKKAVDGHAEIISSKIKENKEDDVKMASRKLLSVCLPVKEIEPETNATDDGDRFHKRGRRYRVPSRSDDSEA